MEYTIKKLAQMAGVSARTLRYYDEIGLLKPSRISSSGYRIYTEREVDLLQQIMFYRTLDFKLEEIEKLIYDPRFNETEALEGHLKQLTDKVKELTAVIHTVEKTIAYKKGEIIMTDNEKFEGFKKEAVKKNEEKYGKEIREKYGEETVEASNKKYLNLSKEEFEKMSETEEKMLGLLTDVTKSGKLDSEEAKMIYTLHKQWLGYTWNFYTPQAHKGLAEMYVADERFASYYNNKACEGATQTLHDIIVKYAN